MTTLEAAIAGYIFQLQRQQPPRGGLPPPLLETMHVVKERVEGGRGVAAVRCDSIDHRRLFGIVEVSRLPDGDVRVTGGTWGLENLTELGPAPSVNLAGAWAKDWCWAGGHVHGAVTHHVRLVDASGEKAAEDVVEGGIVLLTLVGSYQNPCTVELYDSGGSLLKTQLHAPPDLDHIPG
jgi:hypothetical protein